MAENKNKRKQISTRTRFEVFKRDGFVCQYCGSHPPNVILHVDHIIPVAEGGKNEMDNYVTSCDKCNLGKSNVSLKDIPQSLKDKALDVAEKEAQIQGYYNIMESKRQRIIDQSWEIACVLDPEAEAGFNKAWRKSIEQFLEKLPYHDVLDAMEIAVIKKPYRDKYAFQYFCGICWNKIRRNENG